MRRSLPGLCGLTQSYFKYLIRSTAMRSAADIDDVGWPEPAAVVHLMLSTRSWAPSSDARESKSSIATIQAEKDARSDDSGRPASGERIKWFTFHASIGAIHALTRN